MHRPRKADSSARVTGSAHCAAAASKDFGYTAPPGVELPTCPHPQLREGMKQPGSKGDVEAWRECPKSVSWPLWAYCTPA